MRQDRTYGIIGFHDFDDSRKFLIVRPNTQDTWSFPKGHPEIGETAIQTAQREFIEETGIKDFEIICDKIFEEEYLRSKDGEDFIKIVGYYLARVDDIDFCVQECEITEGGWFDHIGARELLRDCSKNLIDDVVEYFNSNKK